MTQIKKAKSEIFVIFFFLNSRSLLLKVYNLQKKTRKIQFGFGFGKTEKANTAVEWRRSEKRKFEFLPAWADRRHLHPPLHRQKATGLTARDIQKNIEEIMLISLNSIMTRDNIYIN